MSITIGSEVFEITPNEFHNFELLENIHKRLSFNQTFEIPESEFVNRKSFKNLLRLLRSDYAQTLSEIIEAIKLSDYLMIKNDEALANTIPCVYIKTHEFYNDKRWAPDGFYKVNSAIMGINYCPNDNK